MILTLSQCSVNEQPGPVGHRSPTHTAIPFPERKKIVSTRKKFIDIITAIKANKKGNFFVPDCL